MKNFLLPLLIAVLYPLTGNAVSLSVDANGMIINTTPTKFKAGKLMVCDAAGNNCVEVTSSAPSDTAFAASWNGATTIAPSKNAIYDWAHLFDTDDDGKPNVLDLLAGIPKTDASGVLSLAVAGTDYVAPTGIDTAAEINALTTDADFQITSAALALAGFSSITGRIGNANLPLGAQLYDTEGTHLIFDADAQKIYSDATSPSTVVIDWSDMSSGIFIHSMRSTVTGNPDFGTFINQEAIVTTNDEGDATFVANSNTPEGMGTNIISELTGQEKSGAAIKVKDRQLIALIDDDPDEEVVMIDWADVTKVKFFGGASYVTDDGVFTGDGSGLTNLPSSDEVASTSNVLKGDGAGNAVAATPGTDYSIPEHASQLYVYDDFINNTITTFTGGTTGGTAPASATGDIGRPGLKTLVTSTSASGASYIWDGNSIMWVFSGGEAVYETSVKVVTLSDGTETFTVRCGWNDSQTADGADGVYFRYTHGENSGRWVLVARSNSVETATNSTATVPANGWDRLRIVVNAAGTAAEGFVDGVSIGTVASNIPITQARATGMTTGIVKSAGTTSRNIVVDYIMVKQAFTATR